MSLHPSVTSTHPSSINRPPTCHATASVCHINTSASADHPSVTSFIACSTEHVLACYAQALGIALKLTWQGDNQLLHIETYFSLMVSADNECCLLVGADGEY
eukprot:1161529-Pelagomonas_calceolata.AAC.5